jgi:hypothetical protein
VKGRRHPGEGRVVTDAKFCVALSGLQATGKSTSPLPSRPALPLGGGGNGDRLLRLKRHEHL